MEAGLVNYGAGDRLAAATRPMVAGPSIVDMIARAALIIDGLNQAENLLFDTYCRLHGPRPKEVMDNRAEKRPDGQLWALNDMLVTIEQRTDLIKAGVASIAAI